MKQSDEGLQILEERPRITSKHVDLEKLKSFPEGTFGKAYSNFLVKNVRTFNILKFIHTAHNIQ